MFHYKKFKRGCPLFPHKDKSDFDEISRKENDLNRTICRPEIALFLLLMFGCFRSDSAVPVESVAPVAGTVVVNKMPVAGVTLSFAPTEGTSGRGGVAISDAEGKFKVTNSLGAAGLVPGKYQVTFSRWTLADGSAAPADLPPADAGASEAIDEKWSSPTHAGPHNTITIPAEGTSELKFEISSTFQSK